MGRVANRFPIFYACVIFRFKMRDTTVHLHFPDFNASAWLRLDVRINAFSATPGFVNRRAAGQSICFSLQNMLPLSAMIVIFVRSYIEIVASEFSKRHYLR